MTTTHTSTVSRRTARLGLCSDHALILPNRGDEVALSGVIVPLPRLQSALDIHQLSLRQVQTSG